MVQGMTTMASGGFEPLANGAFMLFTLCSLRPGVKFQPVRQLLRNDLLRVIAEHDVDFVSARIQIVQQALRVERAAGSGDGDENLQRQKS